MYKRQAQGAAVVSISGSHGEPLFTHGEVTSLHTALQAARDDHITVVASSGDSGVVSYRAEVDPRALGYAICAIVRVSPATRDLPRIPETARAITEITECYRITGEDCYFMTLYLRSIDDLEAVLDRFTPYGRTTTSIVHSAPVPRRGLPLTEPPQS